MEKKGVIFKGSAQSGKVLVTDLESCHSVQNAGSGRSQAAFVLVVGSVSFSYSISM